MDKILLSEIQRFRQITFGLIMETTIPKGVLDDIFDVVKKFRSSKSEFSNLMRKLESELNPQRVGLGPVPPIDEVKFMNTLDEILTLEPTLGKNLLNKLMETLDTAERQGLQDGIDDLIENIQNGTVRPDQIESIIDNYLDDTLSALDVVKKHLRTEFVDQAKKSVPINTPSTISKRADIPVGSDQISPADLEKLRKGDPSFLNKLKEFRTKILTDLSSSLKLFEELQQILKAMPEPGKEAGISLDAFTRVDDLIRKIAQKRSSDWEYVKKWITDNFQQTRPDIVNAITSDKKKGYKIAESLLDGSGKEQFTQNFKTFNNRRIETLNQLYKVLGYLNPKRWMTNDLNKSLSQIKRLNEPGMTPVGELSYIRKVYEKWRSLFTADEFERFRRHFISSGYMTKAEKQGYIELFGTRAYIKDFTKQYARTVLLFVVFSALLDILSDFIGRTIMYLNDYSVINKVLVSAPIIKNWSENQEKQYKELLGSDFDKISEENDLPLIAKLHKLIEESTSSESLEFCLKLSTYLLKQPIGLFWPGLYDDLVRVTAWLNKVLKMFANVSVTQEDDNALNQTITQVQQEGQEIVQDLSTVSDTLRTNLEQGGELIDSTAARFESQESEEQMQTRIDSTQTELEELLQRAE